ncbi:hypothetical protein [Cohnella hongkongensis]|uniref:Uncharacterized protein n=1 Tax=Cohnella hongkongensis TaxID=178337 RepID=A0ABV9FGA1_9BACL
MNSFKILLFHILLHIALLIFYIFFLNEASGTIKLLLQLIFVLFAPLFYIYLGYRYTDGRAGFKRNVLRFFNISIVGFMVWLPCFYHYITDDVHARAENAFFVLPSEIVWIFYGLFNSFLLYIGIFVSWIGYFQGWGNKYAVSVVILVINFVPSFFIWIGWLLKSSSVEHSTPIPIEESKQEAESVTYGAP